MQDKAVFKKLKQVLKMIVFIFINFYVINLSESKLDNVIINYQCLQCLEMALMIANFINDSLIIRTVKIIRVDFKHKFQKFADELFENLILINKFLKKSPQNQRLIKESDQAIKTSRSIFKSNHSNQENSDKIQASYIKTNLKNEILFKKIFNQENDIKNNKLLSKLPFRNKLENKLKKKKLSKKIKVNHKMRECKSTLLKKNSEKFNNILCVGSSNCTPELRRAVSNISAKGREINKLKISLKIPSFNTLNSNHVDNMRVKTGTISNLHNYKTYYLSQI